MVSEKEFLEQKFLEIFDIITKIILFVKNWTIFPKVWAAYFQAFSIFFFSHFSSG